MNETFHHVTFMYWYNSQSGELPRNSTWIKMAKLLLDKGAEVNSLDDHGGTALMTTIRNGTGHNAELVKLLLSRGADPKAKTSGGESVLEYLKNHPDNPYRKSVLGHKSSK